MASLDDLKKKNNKCKIYTKDYKSDENGCCF